MLSHEEFSCWIELEGEKAKEYCIEKFEDDDGGPTITCWIASRTGKQFTVHWKDSKASTDVIGWVTVDGNPTSNGLISIKGNPDVEQTTEGFSVSDDEIRPLFFKRIEFSDDDKRLKKLSKHFGTILIQINRCTAVVPQPHERPIFADSSDLPIKTVHEEQGKEKNAMFHQVGAGPPTQRQRDMDYLNCLDEVKAIDFIFKYRTTDELIAMEIAPDPRSKNKRKAVDEVIIVSDDEVEAKTQRLRRNARHVKKRVRDSEYMPRPSSSHHSSPLQTQPRAFKLRRSTRHIKKMIRKEQDNIRPTPSPSDSDSESSRHSSESSQDSDDPVQTIASPSSTGHVTQKIIKKEDEDDVLLHSDVPAYSTQMASESQSSMRHVKKEELTPSSYVAPKEVKGPKHSANCTNCKRPIYGARFKCTHAHCQDYNLCEACEALPEPVHPLEHSLLKIRTAS